MSEHICEKCKWNQGLNECWWIKGNNVPSVLSAMLGKLIITKVVSECPTFEEREENSCLNCKHAKCLSDDYVYCSWRPSEVPSAWIFMDYDPDIKRDNLYTNCPTWEEK